MASRRKVTDQEIEDGLSEVAKLIKEFGDDYWPVFDRLERELQTRRSRSARLASRLNSGAALRHSKTVSKADLARVFVSE